MTRAQAYSAVTWITFAKSFIVQAPGSSYRKGNSRTVGLLVLISTHNTLVKLNR